MSDKKPQLVAGLMDRAAESIPTPCIRCRLIGERLKEPVIRRSTLRHKVSAPDKPPALTPILFRPKHSEYLLVNVASSGGGHEALTAAWRHGLHQNEGEE